MSGESHCLLRRTSCSAFVSRQVPPPTPRPWTLRLRLSASFNPPNGGIASLDAAGRLARSGVRRSPVPAAAANLVIPAPDGSRIEETEENESVPLPPDMPKPQPAADRGWLGSFLKSYYLLLAIAAGVAVGLLFPAAGRFAHSQLQLTGHCTFAIFLISGLMLDLGELQRALTAWPAFVYGVVSSLLLTPWVAPVILRLPFQPPGLSTGLALFCCMPATITAGISLARAADANVTLALAITVFTNTLGIFTIPLFLGLFMSPQQGLTLPTGPLLKGLVLQLLLPLAAGMAARSASPCLAKAADKRKQMLSLANNTLLSLVPWMQVSSARETILCLTLPQILPVALCGLAVHVLFLFGNMGAMRAMRGLGLCGALSAREADAIDRAVILLASQKTLPVAATVVQRLGTVLGPPVLLLLPCVLTHFLQIFVDTFLVSRWLASSREAHPAARKAS